MSIQKRRIVVAMSGGVDSSTVAAMLKEQGHEVIGITLQLYDINTTGIKKGTCCAGIDIYDAKNVAEKLDIPHYVLNYESKFRESVIDDFADSYLRGETPIPCIKCNQTVKFSDLFKTAKDLQADALATGHYVQKKHHPARNEMHKGKDSKKDQSYFLFATTQEQLDFLEFPLGGYSKNQTRELARKYELEIAEKPDSQDICFVPDGNYKKVIEKFRPGALDPGNILDMEGNILGKHNGIIGYTIGQRKGLGISSSEPYYVIKIDATNNSVVIGREQDLQQKELYIKNTNWLIDQKTLEKPREVQVKLRSTQAPCKATICQTSDNGVYRVELKEYQKSITPGQACVAYDGTRLLGGGWIISA